MNIPKPRVFVSSVMDGFEAYRQAAREGIAAADREPVLVEDGPSSGNSSRTACLDLVQSSDGFILIIGERGGWTTPLGKLVVEEELEEAISLKLPVRVFLQKGVARDAEAEKLAREVSDYLEGYFRKTFTDPASLSHEVKRAVQTIDAIPSSSMAVDPRKVRALAQAIAPARQQQTGSVPPKTLRIVLAPMRAGEVIDPIKMDDETFQYDVMQAAQHPKHRIVDYGDGVVPRLSKNALVLERKGARDAHGYAFDPSLVQAPRIEIRESGLLLVDVLAEPTSGSGFSGGMMPPHVVDAGRVEQGLTAALCFAGALYDMVDPGGRYAQLLVDMALSGAEGGVLEDDPKPRSSYTVPHAWMFGGQGASGPVTPLDDPRPLSRRDLRDPDTEVRRIMTYLRRQLRPS